MSEDEIIEGDFYRFWAGLSVQLEPRVIALQSAVDGLFDSVRYAGLGDDISAQKPFSVDLTGHQAAIPYTISLYPGRSVDSITDQFDFESKSLLRHLQMLSEQYRLLTAGSQLSWVRPLTIRLVMPPTTEELIKFRGRAQGFDYYNDMLQHPAIWVTGRVIIGPVKLQ